MAAVHTIRTTLRPDVEVTVDHAEYEYLLDMGLIYDGTPPNLAADPFDARVAAYFEDDTSSTHHAARRAFSTRGRGLLNAFASPDTGIPPLSTDLPAVTWAGAKSLARWTNPLSTEFRIRGNQGTWDSPLVKLGLGGNYSALDFFLTGTQVEIGLVEQVANGSLLWVFVDGKPITAGPTLGMATGAGGQFWIKLAWGGAAKRRRITVHASSANAWQGVAVDMAASLAPAPPLLRLAFIGDSFFGGSGAASFMESAAFLMGVLLGVDAGAAAIGGTGYVAGAPETFGSVSRVAAVTQKTPDLLVFSGSMNDPVAGLQAAAAACFAAYNEALPGVPAIVFGPQPSSAVATLSADRAAAIAAVRTAAEAAPNVIAFRDMVGTGSGTVPPDFSGFTTYNPGDLVTYAGSVWRWSANVAGSSGPYYPGIDGYYWSPVTYAFTGTGQVDAPVGDGNRDAYLYSDSVHPTAQGSLALATRQAAEIRAVLASNPF